MKSKEVEWNCGKRRQQLRAKRVHLRTIALQVLWSSGEMEKVPQPGECQRAAARQLCVKGEKRSVFEVFHDSCRPASAPELTQWSQAVLPSVPASAHIRLDGVSIWTVA